VLKSALVHNTCGKPIRILYVHHTFRNQSYNSLLWNIANRIDKRRYLLFAACLREGGPYEDKLRDIGVTVKNFGLKTLLDLRIILRLVRYIRENSIDIVQTAVFPADVYGRISASLARVPIIISTMHRVEDHKQEAIYRILFLADTLTMPLTTKIIAVSEAVKNYLVSWHKVRPDKISVIYNGIDTHKYDCNIDIREYKKALELQHNIPTIAFIGRLVKVKGLKYFLRAAASILRKGETVQFLVIGDGPLENHFIRRTRHLGIDKHVSFLGFREDIPHILSAIDVLVVPSLREGLPLTILEAMVAEKPIIATNVGGIPEAIKHRETGILIPPRDATKLAEAILDLLKDPVRCKKMGEKGKERALKYFDIGRMVKEYDHLYTMCTGPPANRK
jgi:glycosyltransferase involved in cell wall biosynthesis